MAIILFFFFNDTATTEIYTLPLHDALPIYCSEPPSWPRRPRPRRDRRDRTSPERDRKSTRLNSSHSQISYAVFCLKKKKRKHSSALQLKSMQKSSNARPCSRDIDIVH